MSRYLSRKIQFISLFSMLSVVFIHSYNYKDSFLTPTTTISEGMNYGAMFQYFFSNALLRFAVPLFFIISGYLFYKSFENIRCSYLKKLKTRFFSLAIPYIIWSAISGGFFLLLNSGKILGKLPIVVEKTQENFLFYFLNPPAFQLWYIQQIIIFAVLCPLIYLLIKYTKGIIIVPVAVLWALDLHFIINSQALFFYCVGAYFAIFNKEKWAIKKDHPAFTVSITVLWVALSGIITWLAVAGNDNLVLLRLLLYRTNEIAGLIAVWTLFDHIFKRLIKKKIMILASSQCFIIFVLHEPLLHVTTQLSLLGNSSDISHFILYICLPVSVIAVCIIIGMCIKKICKPVYSVLTGGRTKRGIIK